MLHLIDKKAIGAEWDRVRVGLVAVKKATTDDWLPEDIYMALRTGAASLYIGSNISGEYLGFVVMRLVPTFHASKVEIWAAYSATKAPAMRQFFKHIKVIAHQNNANLITFSSARPEWALGAKRLGFKPQQVTYEYSLLEQS